MATATRTVIRLKGNFFGIPNDIIDKYGRTIGAIGVGVYAALARFADARTGECWPAIARLERVLNLARSTVKLYLRKLEEAGLIEIEERWADPGDRDSNLYTLLDADPASVATRIAARAAASAHTETDHEMQPAGGGSADNPPVGCVSADGGPAGGPYQNPPEQNQENKQECSRTDEKLAPPPKKNCPHPSTEVFHFDGMMLCHHCWTLLDERAVVDASSEGHIPTTEVLCLPAA
jgi:DNA-binding MarR family transcriptional regulator